MSMFAELNPRPQTHPARWIDRGHTAGHTLGAHFSTSLGVPDIVELCSVSSKSLIYKDFG